MDIFIDKLAQKITAQEMIKANTQAEAEETEMLKVTINGYKEALDRVRQLADESLAKIDEANLEIEKISEATAEAAKAAAEKGIKTEQLDELAGKVKESVDKSAESLQNEVHKECVKVYRNVQAVIVEEGNKHANEVKSQNSDNRSKISLAVGFSIAAFVCSFLNLAAIVALFVLQRLNIKLF
ncbi:MAG: hypothetical protein K6D96_03460 [Acetatifactor sp.]|nr:hypothetical protein [Acetatifactor sp.]